MKIFEILRNSFIGIEEEELIPVLIDSLYNFLLFLTSEAPLISLDRFLLIHDVLAYIQEELRESTDYKGKGTDTGLKLLVVFGGVNGFVARMVNKIFNGMIFQRNEEIYYQNYYLFLQKTRKIEEFYMDPIVKAMIFKAVLDCENEKKAVFSMKILTFLKSLTENEVNLLREFHAKKQGTELFRKCLLEFIYENSKEGDLLEILKENNGDLGVFENIIRSCPMNKKAFWYEKMMDSIGVWSENKENRGKIKRILRLFDGNLDYNDKKIVILRWNFLKKGEIEKISGWFIVFIANFIENTNEITEEFMNFIINFVKNKLKSTPSRKAQKLWLAIISNLIYYHGNEKTHKLINSLSNYEIDPSLILTTRVNFISFNNI